jgi:DNA-binding transcriptional ArsR family regulator
MIDQIRRDIQQRLNQVLSEADRLRRALAALGSHDGAARSAEPSATKPARTRQPAARRTQAGPAETKPRTRAPSTNATETRARAASGATRGAVLDALASGNAMTAGEVATATGLGRASVSTTLSKLARSGEVTKAERGYRLASASASTSGE